jgi:IS30 family transposase
MDRQSQDDLTALANEIADTPCSALKYQTPRSMTLALLRDRSDDA